MTKFIPEQLGIFDPLQRQVLRVALSKVSANCYVRTPLTANGWSPTCVIADRDRGWLPIILSDLKLKDDSPEGLLTLAQSQELNRLLSDTVRFNAAFVHEPSNTLPLNYLVLMWHLTEKHCHALNKLVRDFPFIRFVDKQTFIKNVNTLVMRYIRVLDIEAEIYLRQQLFPETLIPASYSANSVTQGTLSSQVQPVMVSGGDVQTRELIPLMECSPPPYYFLDDEQELAVKSGLAPVDFPIEEPKDLSLRLVNGVAGSGKTLILLSRALLLCRMYPDHNHLLLIHSVPIVNDILRDLEHAWGAVPANLKVMSFNDWAEMQWEQVFEQKPQIIVSTDALLFKLRMLRRQYKHMTLSDQQLIDEIHYINEHMLEGQSTYLTLSRVGRGFALRLSERKITWRIYEALQSWLKANGKRLRSDLVRDVCLEQQSFLSRDVKPTLASDQKNKLLSYHSILLDETQLFAPSWFELIKLSVLECGDVFMCADPNQGFLKSRMSWKQLGIDVRGRTKRLRQSYRGTYEILSVANALLPESKSDAIEHLKPDYHHMRHGDKPALIYAANPQSMVDELITCVRKQIESDVDLKHDILILYTNDTKAFELYQRLIMLGGSDRIVWLNKSDRSSPHPPHAQSYIKLAELTSAAGLEASCVYILGADHILVADTVNGDDLVIAENLAKRRLYMAMTRAIQRLTLFACRSLPQEIEALF